MEAFSALLTLCAGNSPVPTQRPVTRSFDVSFDLHLNKRLSKQSWGCPDHYIIDTLYMVPKWNYMMTYWMGTFPASLALYEGNPPVTSEFPSQRPVTGSFDDFFDVRLNKILSKQSRCWWFETPWRWLWSHCNDNPWEAGFHWSQHWGQWVWAWMQQATHPMWDYVRGRLRKQAAFTHSIENSVILDGSRHVCTNLMSYTHLYVPITTYSWDETFENDDNLKKKREWVLLWERQSRNCNSFWNREL